MKKTLSINISGFVFHIDEDAYEKLHRYLEAIKFHFRGFKGKDEVISDVEARVAEILQQKLSASKEVITMEDVEEVIGILGQPADFAVDDEDEAGAREYVHRAPYKRLYRDPERKWFGGVCSGLGAYFNIDPIWVRLIFFVSNAISGFGLLIYIILWLALPEARTTAERLEMRGEPVNISNIEKSIGDEVHDLKDKLHDFTSRTKSNLRKRKEEYRSGQRDQFLDSIGEIGRVFLRIFLIIAGTVILMLGIALTFIYFSIVFHYPVITLFDHAGTHTFPLYPLIDKIFTNDADLRTLSTGLMIVIGIPLLMMLWGGIRLIFNLPRAKFISGAAALIWVCAFVITLIFGFKVFNSFQYQGNFNKESVLQINKTEPLELVAIQNLPTSHSPTHSDIIKIPECRIVVTGDANVFYCIPELKIKPSIDSTARLVIGTSARGPFSNEAAEMAENINYTWQLKGDTLFFPDCFTLSSQEKWRKQEARIDLFLPVGTVFYIDEDMYPILGYHKNYSRREMAGGRYVMTADGVQKRD
jgi:phage shock protein PspC (stress-responsive transcriptional regulator)